MESDSEFMVVVARSCRAVERAVEKYDEEKSPTSLDSLLFCTNELYRLLMATSGEQNQDLEEVGRGIGLLNEIERGRESLTSPVTLQILLTNQEGVLNLTFTKSKLNIFSI